MEGAQTTFAVDSPKKSGDPPPHPRRPVTPVSINATHRSIVRSSPRARPGNGARVTRRDGKGGVLGIADFGTEGGEGDAIAISAGGAARPLVSLDRQGVTAFARDDLRLAMNGRDVFNFVMTRVADSIAACLARNGLTLEEIDLFALHQGSLYMLQMLARRAGIPDDKLLVNIGEFGNTVSSTIPLLLEPLLAGGALRGKRVLVSGFGVGLSWATAVLRF